VGDVAALLLTGALAIFGAALILLGVSQVVASLIAVIADRLFR